MHMHFKPESNELDFSQYNMQHLSSGKSCDRLTTVFIPLWSEEKDFQDSAVAKGFLR